MKSVWVSPEYVGYRAASQTIRLTRNSLLVASGESELIRLACAGDECALAKLFSQHRRRLKRMVETRLDDRLRGRLDASDVLQEVFPEFVKSLPRYSENKEISLYLWLRHLTQRKLQAVHRSHLGVKMRDARRETTFLTSSMVQATSRSLASQLLGRQCTPSSEAMRVEAQQGVQIALAKLAPIDREILLLRHFEQLSNLEAAAVLEISPPAASVRYVRALQKLKECLANS